MWYSSVILIDEHTTCMLKYKDIAYINTLQFTFQFMIPTDCKITNFSLYMFVYFFKKLNNYACLIHAYYFKRKTGQQAPHGLIIGTPIHQYALYSAMFCPLHSNVSKVQHEKYQSNHYENYGKFTREILSPYLNM